jgi:hypothetical protein
MGVVMPLVAFLREGAVKNPVGWHRNAERRARGLFPVTSLSQQLEPWERQLALVEILLLSGGTPHANFKDLAHAWGREKGFHQVLAQSVCERRGEVDRKRRSDAGRTMTSTEREEFKRKMKRTKTLKIAAKAQKNKGAAAAAATTTDHSLEAQVAAVAAAAATADNDDVENNAAALLEEDHNDDNGDDDEDYDGSSSDDDDDDDDDNNNNGETEVPDPVMTSPDVNGVEI